MSSCCSVNGKTAQAPAVMACPACGSRSRQVEPLTVKSLVRHLPFGMCEAQYYFCEASGCPVVFFPAQAGAPAFRQADLLVPVGAKQGGEEGLVCYCFGVTRKDILAEIERTARSSFAARIKAEVKAGNCACEVKNPSGKCCLGNVNRTVKEGLQGIETVNVRAEVEHGR